MEQWEIELREKLQRELPDGAYQIGGPGMIAHTGKGGAIDFRVALVKSCMKAEVDPESFSSLPVAEPTTYPYKELTYDELKRTLEELLYTKRTDKR